MPLSPRGPTRAFRALPLGCAVALSLGALVGGGLAQPPPGEGAPAPAAPSATGSREITIGATGDLLAHIRLIEAARLHEAEGGFGHVLGGMRAVIDEQEIAFLNLETPLSERIDAVSADPPILGAPAAIAPALAEVGFDVASVANNHAFDQGADGLADTLGALREAGIASVGAAAGDGDPFRRWVARRGAVRVAFVAVTERLNRGAGVPSPPARLARFDEEAVRGALAAAREAADVVVLSIHWSHDFAERPSRRQRELARQLVEDGADLVLGHGPHVLQEVERTTSPRGDAVIAYSLGNFVSNQGLVYRVGRVTPSGRHPAAVLPTTRDGVWLRTTFRLDAEGQVRVAAVRAVALWTRNNHRGLAMRPGDRRDIRVGPLSACPLNVRRERYPAIRAALGEAVEVMPVPLEDPAPAGE
ncbi:MAG: CapA family protein [Sandaracinaceae bacterium]